jgi:3-oxoacyl-[acyl-carrier protein] reductase
LEITELAVLAKKRLFFVVVNQLFITGGSGGLGQAIQAEFDSPGWQITAPRREILDLKTFEHLESVLNLRPIDLFVFAAGITRDAPLTRIRESDWDEVYSVNYKAASACVKAVLPGMIEQGRGHIILISSYSAIHPPIGQVAYATAKAALLGLTTALAAENGVHGIRVNAILPGFLETRMTETVSIQRKKEILATHALGRFNTPHRVAGFIRFLHEELTETSGQVFQLDSRFP